MKVRDWSLPSKILIGSLTGLLLSFGLCGVGTGFEGRGTPLQNTLGLIGFWLFLLSGLGLLLGVLAAIISAIRGYN